MQKAVINPGTIVRPKTVFIRKLPTSLHNRSVNKSEDESFLTRCSKREHVKLNWVSTFLGKDQSERVDAYQNLWILD